MTTPAIRRILAIKLGHIGDVLLMTPALDLLRRAFPEAEISVLLRRGTEPVLRGNPNVKEIIIGAELGKKKSLGERAPSELRLIKRLRQQQFDLAVNFSASDRGAIVGLLSGAALRVGYPAVTHGLWGRDRLYTHLCKRDWLSTHTVLKDAQLVCDFATAIGLRGFDNPSAITGNLRFAPSAEALAFAEDFWRCHATSDTRVVIHPTSRWLFKCWSDENVAALADKLCETFNASVLLTTGPDEKEISKGKRILALSRTPPVARLGDSSLDQLAALIQRAHLFVGVDTAPMHVAAAVGTPVVALFGPSLDALWRPWGISHHVIRHRCPCIEQNKIACDKSKVVACMAQISVEEVLAAAKKVFDLPPV
jgi:heptosyltransferase-3